MISILMYDVRFTMYDLFTIVSLSHLGYGVIAGTAPGVTAANAFDAEPAAFEDAVFEDGFDHILTACRCISAGRGCKRRDEGAIEIDGEEENFSDESFPLLIVDC